MCKLTKGAQAPGAIAIIDNEPNTAANSTEATFTIFLKQTSISQCSPSPIVIEPT